MRGFTGLVDLYVMTGNRTYLDAALGGWALIPPRDSDPLKLFRGPRNM